MDNRSFASLMSSLNDRSHGVLAQGWSWLTGDMGAIVIDDLDVVRTFCNSCINKGLCVFRFGQGRNRNPKFGPVSTWNRNHSHGRAKIGEILPLMRLEKLLDLRCGTPGGAHIERGRHTKDQCLAQVTDMKDMGMGINQARQKRTSRSLNYSGIKRKQEILSHSGN